MTKKTSIVARRAWELLRALMCARNGELCRSRVAIAANAFHKLIGKVIRSAGGGEESRAALLYGDHEFCFQSTPPVHVRMNRPAAALRFKLPQIPCIRPQAAAEDEDDVMWRERVNRTCYLKEAEEEEMSEESDEGIDERAEEFIAKFYEEMKMQRQISCV